MRKGKFLLLNKSIYLQNCYLSKSDMSDSKTWF